jgi:hypothetical protein
MVERQRSSSSDEGEEEVTTEQQLELMRGMLKDLIVKVDTLADKVDAFVEAAAKRDVAYDKLRQRLLRGALGLLGADESEGAEPPAA